MNSGADDYLTKPFEIPDLLSAIKTRLEKQTLSEYTASQLENLRLHLSASLPHEFRTPFARNHGRGLPSERIERMI